MKLLMYSVCAGLTLYLHYPLYNSNKCFMYNQKMAIIERVPCSAAIGVTVTVGVCLLSRNWVRWYLTHHILVTPLLRAFTSWLWTLMDVNIVTSRNHMDPPPCNPHPPNLSERYEISCPLDPLPTPYKQPMSVLCNCLISISYTTWRWLLSSAETCSCTLCTKHFIFYQ